MLSPVQLEAGVAPGEDGLVVVGRLQQALGLRAAVQAAAAVELGRHDKLFQGADGGGGGDHGLQLMRVELAAGHRHMAADLQPDTVLMRACQVLQPLDDALGLALPHRLDAGVPPPAHPVDALDPLRAQGIQADIQTRDTCSLERLGVLVELRRVGRQGQVFDARQGPCYRCLFPEPPPPGLVPSCSDGGVLGVLPGIIGALQATEALKVMLGIGETLIGRLLLFNALDVSFEFIKLRKDPRCKVCGTAPTVTDLIDYPEFCGIPNADHAAGAPDTAWEITPLELAARLKAGDDLLLLDVREPHELEISSLPGAQLIPLGQLAAQMDGLDRTRELVLICRTGTRSARALEVLTGAGFTHVKNLRGGINAWARAVDPSLAIY